MIYTRRSWGDILSLMHFDFPHYYAVNSALKDEASPETWYKTTGAAFVGGRNPADEIIANSPRYGYRCLYTKSNSDYVAASNSFGTFSLTGSVTRNIELFVNIREGNPGYIWAFMDGSAAVLSLTVSASRNLTLSCSDWGLNLTSGVALEIGSWHHIRTVIAPSKAAFYIDGTADTSADISQTALHVSAFRVGGAYAFFDEFALRSSAATLSVPGEPYQGLLDITKCGGFGDGHDGDFTFTGSGSFSINTHGHVKEYSGTSLRVNSWVSANYFKNVNPGDELMFSVKPLSSASRETDLAGLYAFRKALAVDGCNVTIDSPVTEEFDLYHAVRKYTVYAYKIPNLTSLTFSTGKINLHNHIFAARVSGNVTWGGSVYVEAASTRYDDFALSHSDLPDRMPYYYGSILIFCGGTFTAPSTARIGPPNPYAGPGLGGSSLWDSPVMVGRQDTPRHIGYSFLIAARKLAIDSDALAHGAVRSGQYSGCLYMAGEVA